MKNAEQKKNLSLKFSIHHKWWFLQWCETKINEIGFPPSRPKMSVKAAMKVHSSFVWVAASSRAAQGHSSEMHRRRQDTKTRYGDPLYTKGCFLSILALESLQLEQNTSIQSPPQKDNVKVTRYHCYLARLMRASAETHHKTGKLPINKNRKVSVISWKKIHHTK